MFNTNEPLNAQLQSAPIDLGKPEIEEIYEGGQNLAETSPEAIVFTERHAVTDRGLITTEVSPAEIEDKKEQERKEYLERVRKEALRRLRLEDKVKLNARYKTVFEGLKLNTEHNSAVTQVLLFMIQRIVYASAIVLLSHAPQMATITMIEVSVCILAFVMHEKPWQDSDVNKLAIVNEAFLYAVLVLTMVSSMTFSTADSGRNELEGAVVLLAVTLFIHLNLVALLAKAWNFSKLLYARHQNQRNHGKEAAGRLSSNKRRLACVGAGPDDAGIESAENGETLRPPVQDQVIDEVSSVLEAEQQNGSQV